MKKKRFLSLILMLVMLVSTLVMSGCGTEKKSGNEGNYDGELVYSSLTISITLYRVKVNLPKKIPEYIVILQDFVVNRIKATAFAT